jgi:hypothetical protein
MSYHPLLLLKKIPKLTLKIKIRIRIVIKKQ